MLKSKIYLFLFVLLSMTGCNKFKGDQEIPSYIQIDSIIISQTSANAFGFTPTANITDAWITVDGWNIGGYQLPIRRIPILKKGKHKVLIQAGIRANNLSLRRSVYPFYSGVEFTVNFIEDSIIHIDTTKTVVPLRNTNKYVFKEDFERGKHGFDTVAGYGGIPIEIKQNLIVPAFTPKRLYNEHIGHIHLTKGDSCCIMTTETFTKGTDTELPYNKPIYIEIDYLTNNIFEVGIVSTSNGKTNFHPVVVVGSMKNPQWSKIYVDISNPVTLQLSEGADNFKIFIRTAIEENNDEANIYLDNIRLVFAGKN